VKRVLLGAILVSLFNVLGSVYPVRVSVLLETEDPAVVVSLTFGLAALFFGVLQWRDPKAMMWAFRNHWEKILLLNTSTLLSWMGFTYALKFIRDAATVDAIVFSIPPILTVVFARWLCSGRTILRAEYWASAGILVGLLFLATITLSGKGGAVLRLGEATLFGLGLALVGGVGVVGNTAFAKQLADAKVSAALVLAVRFYLTIFVAGSIVLLFLYQHALNIKVASSTDFILLAVCTVILPLYLLQLGIERCEPLTVNVLFAMAPVFTYLIQYVSSKPAFRQGSILVLIGVLICVTSMVTAVVARARHEKKLPNPDCA
jgi:drug/metabolite transporter (DMT)-like permease